MPENDELKKYLDYDGLAYLLQRFPKTTVHCTFDSEFAGETATLTHGTTTYTKTVPATSPFELTFAVNELGTWTLQSSYLGTQYSDTVDITYLGQKGEVELTIVPNGSTAEPVNSIPVWLKCANLNKSYTTLAEVLADTETYETLLADSNACQYMKRSTGWIGIEKLVPQMTGYTTPSGTVSASSEFDNRFPSWQAFNLSQTYGWAPASSDSGHPYIQYKFEEPTIVNKVWTKGLATSASSTVYHTILKASNDNFVSDTHDLGNVDISFSSEITTEINNSDAYIYYRIYYDTKTSASGWTDGGGVRIQFDYMGITGSQDAMARLGKFDYACNTLSSNDTWKEAIINSDYCDSVYNISVPKMTSNTAPSGTAFIGGSETVPAANAYKAFNKNPSDILSNTNWNQGANACWVGYQFTKSVKCTVALINIGSQSSTLSDVVQDSTFVIQGSNDNSNWTDLSAVQNSPDYIAYNDFGFSILSLNNNQEFLYYRLYFYKQPQFAGSAFDINCFRLLQFYGREKTVQYKATVPTMTGDTTPSGVASDNRHHSAAPAWHAFDGESGDYWESDARGTNNDWVAYKHSEAKNIKRAYLNAVIQASNETLSQYYYIQAYVNDEWTTLATYANSNTSSFSVYVTFDNPYTVTDYRVLISGPLGSNLLQKINRIQFYEEVTGDVIIHSAANDTVYYIDGEDNQMPICTTDENGVGKCDLTSFQAGPVTLYSSVAKNPDDLTADYSKTITITKTQYGGTTEAYLMPDTIKTLYWWGYEDENLEDCSTANGWVVGYTNYGFNAPTHNTNYIAAYSNHNNNTSAIGTKNAISGNKAHAVTQGITPISNIYINFEAGNSKTISQMDDAVYTYSTSMEHTELNLSDLSQRYIMLGTGATRKGDLYALWYE